MLFFYAVGKSKMDTAHLEVFLRKIFTSCTGISSNHTFLISLVSELFQGRSFTAISIENQKPSEIQRYWSLEMGTLDVTSWWI